MLVAAIAYFVYDSNRRGAVGSQQRPDHRDRPAGRRTDAFLPARRPSSSSSSPMPPRPVAASSRAVPRSSGSPPRAGRASLLPRRSATPIPRATSCSCCATTRGGFDTKTIDRRNGGHRVTWVRRDAGGQGDRDRGGSGRHLRSAHATLVPGRGAARRSRSGPTPTCSSPLQKPGITFSIPHFDADGQACRPCSASTSSSPRSAPS